MIDDWLTLSVCWKLNVGDNLCEILGYSPCSASTVAVTPLRQELCLQYELDEGGPEEDGCDGEHGREPELKKMRAMPEQGLVSESPLAGAFSSQGFRRRLGPFFPCAHEPIKQSPAAPELDVPQGLDVSQALDVPQVVDVPAGISREG